MERFCTSVVLYRYISGNLVLCHLRMEFTYLLTAKRKARSGSVDSIVAAGCNRRSSDPSAPYLKSE